jgi:tRNA pseudouridine38-40 synthase
MKTAAEKLVGTHDFASFRDSSCSAKTSIRTVESSVVELDYPYLRYRIVGNGFLKQMVRNIVGTLVLIGRGHLQDIQPILEACDRSQAGPTAPAHGLCLEWVDYNRSEFKPKPLFPEDLFWGQKV